MMSLRYAINEGYEAICSTTHANLARFLDLPFLPRFLSLKNRYSNRVIVCFGHVIHTHSLSRSSFRKQSSGAVSLAQARKKRNAIKQAKKKRALLSCYSCILFCLVFALCEHDCIADCRPV
jgi:hypothetical protein